MNDPKLQTIHGEPSLTLRSDCVRAWLAPRGGMLGPVEFTLPGGRMVQPYSLSPWYPAEFAKSQPSLLQVLRGDFFCFPFGSDATSPQPHGPTANETWAISRAEPTVAELSLASEHPRAKVGKRVTLRAGETNLYQEHTIIADGRYNFGHHPILHIPYGHTAEVRISPFRFGGVYRAPGGPPAGERFALEPGARFTAMDAVPLAAGGAGSLRQYPIRPSTEDIVMFAGFEGPHAWTAVTLDGFVWFSLRRTADFPGTLFWMSNGGRDAAPWNGRHTRRIGVEDVCSHFCDGLEISTRDLLAAEHIPTSRLFKAGESVRLPHVQGVVEVPSIFGAVAVLEPVPGSTTRARLRSERGAIATFPLDWSFLA